MRGLKREELMSRIAITVGLSFYWQLFRYSNLSRLLPAEAEASLSPLSIVGASPVVPFYLAVLILALIVLAAGARVERIVQPATISGVGALASAASFLSVLTDRLLANSGTLGAASGVVALSVTALALVCLSVAWARVCSLVVAHDRKGLVYTVCASSLLSLAVSVAFPPESNRAASVTLIAPLLSGALLAHIMTGAFGEDSRARSCKTADSAGSFALPGVVGTLVALLFLIAWVKGFCDVRYANSASDWLYAKHVITMVILAAIVIVCFFALSANRFAFAIWVTLAVATLVGFTVLFLLPTSPVIFQLALGIIAAAKTCLELYLFLVAVSVRPSAASRAALLFVVVPDASAYILGCGVTPLLVSATGTSSSVWLGALAAGAGLIVVVSTFLVMYSFALKGVDSAEGSKEGSSSGLENASPVESHANAADDSERRRNFERVAIARGLTRRECETAFLFFSGYSAKRIAELHYVSLNTTQSHIRSAYRKLGVHNRQELIDSVEREAFADGVSKEHEDD